jgi:hypothetical protein
VLAIIKNNKDGTMSSAESAAPLDCSLSDYSRLDGYASIKEIAGEQRRSSQLFKLIDGGMSLPSLTMPIRATPTLDHFVATELDRFRNPDARKFGENLFPVVSDGGSLRVGHLERYCGSTLRISIAELKAKSIGPIVAIAHTHPFFHRTTDARERNKEGAMFGPGDWTPLLALHVPVYLYTPHRRVEVMEYNGTLVTVRRMGGMARKWRVSWR